MDAMKNSRSGKDDNADFRSLSFDVCTVKALMASTNRYKTLFESAGDAIFVMDFKGQVIDGNRVACEQLRISHHDLLNKTTMDIISPEHAPFWPERMDELRRLRHIIFETALKSSDGKTLPVETSCRAIEYDNKPAVLTIARDISERIQSDKEKAKLRSQLRQAQKMEAIGTLAGGVAHDLNNILSGIVGYPDLLLMEVPESSPMRSGILTIKKSGEKAAAIVQDLLYLARRADGQYEQQVAIKMLPAEMTVDEERRQRFRQEAMLAASFNHPNIAAIYGLEESDGQPVLAMELAEGEDLSAIIARGLLPAALEMIASAARTPELTAASVETLRSTLGADAVIMHGASPTELEPIVDAYATTVRP